MLKVLKNLEKTDIWYFLISLIFIVNQVYLDLKLPDYMSEITRLVQTGGEISEILNAGSWMVAIAIGSFISAIIVGYFVAKIAARLSTKLRGLVFEKTMSFSLEEMSGFSIPSLITRTTNDVFQIQLFVALSLQATVKSPIMALWAIIKISNKSWQWSLTTAVAVGVLLIVLAIVIGLALPKFKIIQQLTDNINRIARENLTGIRVIRAYNAQEYQEEKFEKANQELTKTNLFANRVVSIQQPFMRFLLSSITLAIYWVGVYLLDASVMPERLTIFSDMVVFSTYAIQIIISFMMLTITFIMWPRASVSAKRIKEVLDTPNTIVDGTFNSETDLKGTVEFKNVSFKYPGAQDYVLHDISFTANQGETVAFIGSTGSGKSTLINLVPRLYEPTEGEVLVNGINIKETPLNVLRDKLGYIPQRAVLFSGTIQSNVNFGDKKDHQPTVDDLYESLEIAQAKDFVDKLEQKIEAPVSQGGTNFSGGQKQRIAIARAIARKPEIYVFDDSFSALDYQTDRALRSELKEKLGDATKLIVAQRIGTIMDADKILVLEKGQLVGVGTHQELLKTNKVYQEIAESQLSQEEIVHVG